MSEEHFAQPLSAQVQGGEEGGGRSLGMVPPTAAGTGGNKEKGKGHSKTPITGRERGRRRWERERGEGMVEGRGEWEAQQREKEQFLADEN